MNFYPIAMLLLNDISVQLKQCLDAMIGLHKVSVSADDKVRHINSSGILGGLYAAFPLMVLSAIAVYQSVFLGFAKLR